MTTSQQYQNCIFSDMWKLTSKFTSQVRSFLSSLTGGLNSGIAMFVQNLVKSGDVCLGKYETKMMLSKVFKAFLSSLVTANSFLEWFCTYAQQLEDNMYPILNNEIFR